MRNKNMLQTATLLFVVILLCGKMIAQDAPPAFKPKAKIFGELFGDYYYKVASNDSLWGDGHAQYATNTVDDQAFAFRRVYFGGAFAIAPKLDGKIMYEGEDGNLLTNGKKAAGNLKYAYLKWKLLKNGALVFGAQHTPTWSAFTEKIWGYRSVEKTIFDARKLGGSNDVGVSLAGYFDDGHTIGYNLLLGNGRGQKPENDPFKKVYASVNGRMVDKKLLWEIYTDYEVQNSDDESRLTVKGFLGYQVERLTIGIEGGQQIQSQSYAPDTAGNMVAQPDKVPMGLSFYVRGNLIKDKLNAFFRSDLYDPDTKDPDSGYQYTENFFVTGVDFMPGQHAHFMPNIWVNTYSAKESSLPARSPDVVARLTFWWKFK